MPDPSGIPELSRTTIWILGGLTGLIVLLLSTLAGLWAASIRREIIANRKQASDGMDRLVAAVDRIREESQEYGKCLSGLAEWRKHIDSKVGEHDTVLTRMLQALHEREDYAGKPPAAKVRG